MTFPSPAILQESVPVCKNTIQFIAESRKTIANILQGIDKRLLVIIGPCSIHDPVSALEYAEKIQYAKELFAEDLFIVMRTYFQKPRTALGWKGFLNDPFLDHSYDISSGLMQARKLLLAINNKKIPCATEFIDATSHLYLKDLISWSAVGARTVESQLHREIASGLAMPVGFKNNTDGNIQVALDAIQVANHPHIYLGMNNLGSPSIIQTPGNPHGHLVLRGSHHHVNYHAEFIKNTCALLKKANIKTKIMIDCSHGNSKKNPVFQMNVVSDIIKQLLNGEENIVGMMLESYLQGGRQNHAEKTQLTYGQSITDGCLSWEGSLDLLAKIASIKSQIGYSYG